MFKPTTIQIGVRSVRATYPTGKRGFVLMMAGAHIPKGCLNFRVGQAIMGGMHATRTISQVKLRYKAHFFLVKMDGYLKKVGCQVGIIREGVEVQTRGISRQSNVTCTC